MKLRTVLNLREYRHGRLLEVLKTIPPSDRGNVILDLAEEALHHLNSLRGIPQRDAAVGDRVASQHSEEIAIVPIPSPLLEKTTLSSNLVPKLTVCKGAFNFAKRKP